MFFIADANNNAIRKITSDGTVTTFAGGSSTSTADGIGTAAKFSYPTGLASDQYGNIYVADYANNRIRKLSRVPDSHYSQYGFQPAVWCGNNYCRQFSPAALSDDTGTA
jgi:hypothetical protein